VISFWKALWSWAWPGLQTVPIIQLVYPGPQWSMLLPMCDCRRTYHSLHSLCLTKYPDRAGWVDWKLLTLIANLWQERSGPVHHSLEICCVSGNGLSMIGQSKTIAKNPVNHCSVPCNIVQGSPSNCQDDKIPTCMTDMDFLGIVSILTHHASISAPPWGQNTIHLHSETTSLWVFEAYTTNPAWGTWKALAAAGTNQMGM